MNIFRRLFFIAAFICAVQCIYAQVLIALVFGDKLQTDKLAFGLNVVPTYSTVSNLGGNYKFGLGLGLYFDIKISENFFLHPELLPKSSLGVKGLKPYATGSDSLDALFANGSVQRNIRSMSFPLLCRYRIKGLLFAEAGPQIDMMLHSKDIFSTKINDNELNYTIKERELVTRFDIGVAAGLNCKLKKDKGMGLGLRYYYGFTDMIKNAEGTQTNGAWYIIVHVPIGVAKAAARESGAK